MSTAPVRIGPERPSSAAARRWRSWRWPLLITLILLLTGGFLAAIKPPVSTEPLAVDNAGSDGVRALMQVLGDQGVEVTEVRSIDEATDLAQPGTTLAVVTTYDLSGTNIDQLARTHSDLVLIDADDWALKPLTDNTIRNAWSDESDGARSLVLCSDPDSLAAGSLAGAQYEVTGDPDTTVVCFPGKDGEHGTYAVTQQNGRAVRVIADSTILTNGRIAEAGNAALALRSLGHHERLIWYRPDPTAFRDEIGSSPGSVLPPGSDAVAVWLVIVVLTLAVWRGRAMGRVVAEPLPVTVRAAETSRGRGRLYRRARARGHAAAALRAGTARRCAVRLGLPRSATGPAVINALTESTGRSATEIGGLLYGPPPTTDDELGHLARALEELESEVHRT